MQQAAYLALAALYGLGTGAGCTGSTGTSGTDDTEQSPDAAVDRLEPHTFGCDDYVGESCLIAEAEKPVPLTLWVASDDVHPMLIEHGGLPVPFEFAWIDGGGRYTISIPSNWTHINIHSKKGSSAIEFMRYRPDPDLAELRSNFKTLDTKTRCERLNSLPEPDHTLDRVRKTTLLIGCANPKDPEARAIAMQSAFTLAESAKLRRAATEAAHVIAYGHLERMPDLNTARPWVDREAEAASGHRELEVLSDFTQMLLLRREGRLSQALEAATRSERWAERLGMSSDLSAAREMRVTLLAELGRADDAIRLSQTILETATSEQSDCERARIINNATWPMQMLADAGYEIPQPVESTTLQASLYSDTKCYDPRRRMNARINAAYAALADMEIDLAQDWIARIMDEDLPSQYNDLLAHVEYLNLGIALQTNDWTNTNIALLATNSAAEGDARMHWRIAVRNAQILERFGLDLAAVDAWRGAEAILDRDAASVTLGGGGGSYVSGRSASIVGLVEGLLRVGRIDEALCRARIARGRTLRRAARAHGDDTPANVLLFDAFIAARNSLERDAANDWMHATDEVERRQLRRAEAHRNILAMISREFESRSMLPLADCAALRPRSSGEMILLLLPTPHDTIAISVDDRLSTVERLPPIPSDRKLAASWTSRMLDELAPSVQASTIIRVLPIGRAWSAPVHAADFKGRPVIERMAVVYGLDMPAIRNDSTTGDGALLVTDPSGDLPRALDETREIEHILAHNLETTSLNQAAATREEVLQRIPDATLFHYAGHGARRGLEGWDGALVLDQGASIEVADVLALSRVPRTVVLAGCDTGAVDAGYFDGGMSIGRAFLMAGSQAVVVGDREVDDEVTSRFAAALYGGGPSRMIEAPEEAFRTALQRLSAGGLTSTAWSGFRILVR